MTRVSAKRHWRQTFDKNAPMIMRRRAFNLLPGDSVPDNMPGTRLIRWWKDEVIERADQYPHVAKPEPVVITQIIPIRNSGWFTLKYSNNTEEKIPRSKLMELTQENPKLEELLVKNRVELGEHVDPKDMYKPKEENVITDEIVSEDDVTDQEREEIEEELEEEVEEGEEDDRNDGFR